MPCYNYCPISNSTNRVKPKAEDTNGDCECGSGSAGGCGSGSGRSCEVSPKGTQPGATSTVRARLMPRESRNTCPMMGDIENWPPVYEEEDVQVSETVMPRPPRPSFANRNSFLIRVIG